MKTDPRLRVGESLFTWLLLGFSLFILVLAYRISGFSSISSPGMFPMLAAAVMVLSIGLALAGNRRKRKPDAAGLLQELNQAYHEIFPPLFLIYTAIIVGYMIILQPVHFLPSSFAFLLISMIYLKGAKPLKSLLISGVILGVIYVVFHYFFLVVLP